MNTTDFKAKYNNVSTGRFKDNTTGDIEAEDQRELVIDVGDNFLNFETDFGKYIRQGAATGTDTYAVTITTAASVYASEALFIVSFSNTSTGSATLNINAGGAKKLFKDPSTQAGAGDIVSGTAYLLLYQQSLDGGSGAFLMIGGVPNSGTDHFKGVYASEGALSAAHPTAEEGDYAFVDTGSVDASLYIWDDTDAQWVESGATTVVPDASESTKGIAELATQAETNTGTDDSRIVTALKLKNRDGAVATLTNAATTDITSDKWTWATSSATRTVTFSFTGDKSEGVITLSASTCTLTFPSACLCVSDGVASGDNTAVIAGVSGDKYFVAIRKMGSEYYVVIKNFGQ